MSDMRHALRSLLRAPWYSGTVIGVIALGMALATTVFAVVDGVLFKPLPYPDAGRLVAIQPGFTDLDLGRAAPAVGATDIANWAAAAPDVAITGVSVQWWLGAGEEVKEAVIGVGMVQANFFKTIGVYPLVGGFTTSDFDHADLLRPVIITYDIWQGRFHGASDVVGHTVITDPSRGSGYRVAGVMPRGFVFPSSRVTVGFITPDVQPREVTTDPSRRTIADVIARGPPTVNIGGLSPAGGSRHERGGGHASARTRSLGRFVVVVSQVAGALVLTMGGALLVGSTLAVYAHTPAIRTNGIVMIEESMFGPGAVMHRKSPERIARVNAIVERLRWMPGVEAVAVTGAQILRGGGGMSSFTWPAGAANTRLKIGVQSVTSEFYRVVKPQLMMGRLPTDSELAGDAPVLVVSESVARVYWPHGSPLGQTLTEEKDATPFTVVGVVKDVRWESWDQEIASIYGPYALLERDPFPTVLIRTQANAGRVTRASRQGLLHRLRRREAGEAVRRQLRARALLDQQRR